MKYAIVILITLISGLSTSAQLYDGQWFLSPNPSTVDFRNNTVKADSLPGLIITTLTNANICDSAGNLLFMTNGIHIFDKYCHIAPNGANINPCPYTTNNASDGLNIQQAALFLPIPGGDFYRLLHFSNDTANQSRPGTLYYSIVEGGYDLDTVIEKNVPFCKSQFRGGGMTACKHANGRDYWMVIGGLETNDFYKFLITPDTIFGPYIQSIGPAYTGDFDVAYSKFSQDGSKYATGCYEGLVTIMDFDRCSGEFSNVVTIYNETSSDTLHPVGSGCVAEEFSPNGRFVYVSDIININQYDLWSNNIQDSIEIFRADSGAYALIHFLQLAPNGKLYGSTWNGGDYYLHVINYPELKGDSCSFVYGGFNTLTEDDINLPNMINYNLGPLQGSGCDTIPSAVTVELVNNIQLRVLPNPADKYLYVEMGMQGDYEFGLLNEMGQLIATKETKQVDIFDTGSLASGVYFIKVIDKLMPGKSVTKKIVVQH